MSELPSLPTDPKVIRLSERSAPRTCKVCSADADFYVFVTNDMANERLGTDLGPSDWPVNAFLCVDCFSDAPRVEEWSDLPFKESPA